MVWKNTIVPFHVSGAPPSIGSKDLAISGWIRNNKVAPIPEPVKEAVQAPAQVEVKQETKTVVETITTVSVPTTTVNNGFTSDGVNAILTINSMKGTIVYKVKADTNATFTVTTLEGSTIYPLNFGDKLKVNIIQK